jgi:hypothetical protein
MPTRLDEVKRYRQISDGLVEFSAGRSSSSIRMSKTMSLSFSRDPLNQVAIEAAFTATAKRVVCAGPASTPVSPAAGHRGALAVERQPHFAGSVDPVVCGVDPRDLRLEVLVTDFAAAGLPIDLVVVGRWGDRYTQLGQLCADRLDTPPQTIRAVVVTLMIGDEPGD